MFLVCFFVFRFVSSCFLLVLLTVVLVLLFLLICVHQVTLPSFSWWFVFHPFIFHTFILSFVRPSFLQLCSRAVERKISSILSDKEYDKVFLILTENDLELTKKLAAISKQKEKSLAEVEEFGMLIHISFLCFIFIFVIYFGVSSSFSF
jgi:hypothetical protein